MPTSRTIAAAVMMSVLAMPARADETVLLDHFDDGLLDPAWEISFENADGWTSLVAESHLTVTAIDHVETNLWARVRLTRPVDQLADFHLAAEIAWASASLDEAMQYLSVLVLGAEGEQIAQAFYSDAWVGWRGTLGGCAADACFSFGFHTAPFEGDALFEIDRTGTAVTVRADGGLLIEGNSDTPAERVAIEFGFYPYTAGGHEVLSRFGVESIDFIEITVPGDSCPADLNDDAILDIFDILLYLDAFSSGAPEADWNGDTLLDFFDVSAFLKDFSAGCP